MGRTDYSKEVKKMDYKAAFEAALRWLLREVLEEVEDRDSYNRALENENYSPEYIQDLKTLRRAYLKLKEEQ